MQKIYERDRKKKDRMGWSSGIIYFKTMICSTAMADTVNGTTTNVVGLFSNAIHKYKYECRNPDRKIKMKKDT